MPKSIKGTWRQQQKKREQQIKEEKNRLLSLSEKELLIEILMELKQIEEKIDKVDNSIFHYRH